MVVDLARISYQFPGWSGGMNIEDSPNLLDPDQALLIENMHLNRAGGATKRSGCEARGTFGSASDVAISIHPFYREGGTTQVLIHTSAGKLYYSTNFHLLPATWTLIASDFSATQPLSFETFNNKVYMGDGVTALRSWDGSTLTSFATAPKGKYLCRWQDALWISGITATPSRVYSSEAGNPESYPVANWVDIAVGDGDMVSALANNGLFLIVSKFTRTFEIYDPVEFSNRVVDLEKGFESHFSVVHHENDLYFLSRKGICKYLSDSPSQVISNKIGPYFNEQGLNFATLKFAVGASYENRILWSVPANGQTRNTFQLEYFPALAGQVSAYGTRSAGPWVIHRMPAHAMAVVRLSDNDTLFGSYNAGNSWLQVFANVRHDLGVRFFSTLNTRHVDFGDPTRTKYIRHLRMYLWGKFACKLYRNYNPLVYRDLSVDALASGDLADVVGPAFNLPGELKKTNPDAYGRRFTFSFTDLAVEPTLLDTQVPEWSISGMTVEGYMLGDRT